MNGRMVCWVLVAVLGWAVSVQAIDSAASGYWDAGSTWVGGNVPTASDDVVIKGTHTVTIRTNVAYAIKTLTIENTGTLTHEANGTSAQGERYKVILEVAENATIDAGGMINVDGKGYLAGNGPGYAAGGAYAGGAGYGGEGGYHSATPVGTTYGSITAPTNIGSGQLNNTGTGEGGGAVRLMVAATTTVNGTISASGISSHCAGSGGSIFLTTGFLTGTGTLRANGGGGTASGAAGGGGRIAVIVTNDTSFGDVRMQAYTGGGKPGACGTVYLENTSHSPGHGKLIVDSNDNPANYGTTRQNGVAASSYSFGQIILTNGGVYGLDSNDSLDVTGTAIGGDAADQKEGIYVLGGTLTVPPAFGFSNYFVRVGGTSPTFAPTASLTVGTNATMMFDVPWTLACPLILEAGARVSHGPNGATEANKLVLTVPGDLNIPAGAEINVDGMGYGLAQGPGKTTEWAGAGYGGVGDGRGASGSGQAAGKTYGSITAPTNCGSGANNGAGGGAVILTVTGTTTVNGRITARGGRNDAYPYGVGSGGSIFLTTGFLTGTGTIAADGADANENTTGGGGRVAVILTNSTDFGSVKMQAYPGSPSGAAGTVYRQTSTQKTGEGTVIIDAGNRAAAYAPTRTLIWTNVQDTVVGTVIITNKAILLLSNQWLAVKGSFSNNNAAVASQYGGAVIFTGTNDATVTGANQFWDLTITTATKKVYFAPGCSNVVSGKLTLKNVTVKSTGASTWYLRLASGATQDVGIVTVQYSDARGGDTILAQKGSTDLGNNQNWFFPPIPRGSVFIMR